MYEENSGVGKLTYKKLPTSNINATTIFGMPVDNTNLADGKMLVDEIETELANRSLRRKAVFN